MLKPSNPALASSCPDLLADGACQNSKSSTVNNETKPAKPLPFISSMLGAHQYGVVAMDIVISSAEAEDTEEDLLPFQSNMLPRSRQRSQSLDRLLSTDVSPILARREGSRIKKYRKETGQDCKEGEFCSYQKVFAIIENPESETRWYFKYFLGKVHKNYLGYEIDKTPFFLSVISSSDSVYRCILWKKTGNKRMCFQDYQNGKETTAKAILRKFEVPKTDKLKEVSVASLQEDFLTLEEQEGAVNFKFGILYAHAGQISDDEMFSNENGSPIFDQFLDLLGETVDLLGWTNFKGGLDTKNNATGHTSVYTLFEGHEIMFHVSTMLPYSKENRQQVERKRHIGNDIVVIIFVDGEDDEAYSSALNFNPIEITSHFNHIFALVTYNKARNTYRLVMHVADTVPTFGPPLPPDGEFVDHFDFRDFLMAKLINAEKASYHTPTFAHKRVRTLDMLLKNVEQKCFSSELRGSSGSSPSTGRKNKDLEQSFSEVGQKLKVDKIRKGQHPTSQRTTAFKKDTWDTSCISENFPHKITCGDTCCNGELIVSTQCDGTFIVFTDSSHLPIIDKSLPIAQLVVAHKHKLLLFRSAFTKEANHLYVLPLTLFFSDSISIYNKNNLESYKLPMTKGCHLFCTTSLHGNYLRVVVAIKTKVVMLAWKFLAETGSSMTACSPVTPKLDTFNPVQGFVKHRVFNLPDVPVIMDLMDEAPSGKLCIVYQKYNSVEAVDEITGDMQKIYNIESVKTKVKDMQVVKNNGKNELLLGHSLTCKTVSLIKGMVYSNSPEIMWNAEPKHIVYSPPYILAFTADMIEIRLISNGSLIQSIDIPELKLISQKRDLVFTSKSLLAPQSLTSSENFTRLGSKAGKVLGGKNSTDQQNSVHIYKMRCENSLGRQWSAKSLRSLDKDEETMSSSSQGSVSDDNSPITINDDRRHDDSNHPVNDKLDNMAQSPPNDVRGGNSIQHRSGPGNNHSSPSSRPSRHMLVIPDTNNKDRIVEVNVNYKNSGSGSATLLDSSPNFVVCPSPDSGVLDDFNSLSGHRLINKVDPLHCSSSPCILSDSSPRRSSLPASSILGHNS